MAEAFGRPSGRPPLISCRNAYSALAYPHLKLRIVKDYKSVFARHSRRLGARKLADSSLTVHHHQSDDGTKCEAD
jgi:hypothetical protein